MRGLRVAVGLGVVLLLLGFATGTSEPSTSLNGVSLSCDPAIDLTRLPFNESGRGQPAPPTTLGQEERRDLTACRSATLPLRLVTWTSLGVGGLVVLAGWTALRERGAGEVAEPAPDQ